MGWETEKALPGKGAWGLESGSVGPGGDRALSGAGDGKARGTQEGDSGRVPTSGEHLVQDTGRPGCSGRGDGRDEQLKRRQPCGGPGASECGRLSLER